MTRAEEKRILVVDDEPDVRNYLAAIIEDCGFEVDTAVDGVDALAKIEANPPDLITMDLIMPRLSGVRAMRAMRKNPAWADIPVIVITAHANDEMGKGIVEEMIAESRQMPRALMDKPVTPVKLVRAIADILDVTLEIDPADLPKAMGIR
jgi:two-component system alkaline phosphatase synthesis response regulator PhoP